MAFQHRFVIFFTVLSLLACRPVFAIGWEELLILAGIILFFFGAPLWRFLRTYRNVRDKKKK